MNYFKDLKFRLRMEAKMLNPAFMKQLKLNDRYLDEAQSKRRTAMRSIIRAGQDVVASLK